MNAALVKLDVAAATLGWSAVKLLSLADEGTLIEPGFEWVFNLANNLDGERRDLRFWFSEVLARKSEIRKAESRNLQSVIDEILPLNRKHFHAGEVDALFQIRHRTRIDLHGELAGRMESGRNFYARTALAAFLKNRWIHKNTFMRRTGEGRENDRASGRVPSRSLDKVPVAA